MSPQPAANQSIEAFARMSTTMSKSVAAPTTWTAMISQEAEREAMGAAWSDDLANQGEEFRRWKLLIAVIDCSHGPKLHNPPRTIRALKSRLASALGIEAISKESSAAGAEAATAQAIVSGIEGPERHLLEEDDLLAGFWDRVSSGAPMALRQKDHEDAGEAIRLSKGLASLATANLASALVPQSNGGSKQGSRGTSANRSRRASVRNSLPSTGSPINQPQPAPVGFISADTLPAGAPTPAQLTTSQSSPMSQGGLDSATAAALEGEIRDLQERLHAAENELAACMSNLQMSQADVDVLRDELEAERAAKEHLQEKLDEATETTAQLQEQNLEFIQKFGEQLEKAGEEIRKQEADRYEKVLEDQAKKVVEAESQTKRVDGQLRVTLEKIKDLEGVVRQERSTARRCEADLAAERSRCSNMQDTINGQAARLRQMEFFADTWRRKVAELADARLQALGDPEGFFDFRIMDVSAKLGQWPKGRMIQSPEFDVPLLGHLQFEFFPNGEINSRPGWCSLRIRVPGGTRMRWKARIGNRHFEPREDHYDTSQWWNRYGIQLLNFCQCDELIPEILPQSDSFVVGIEVLKILSGDEAEEVVVSPAARQPASGSRPASPIPSPQASQARARPGTAPQRVHEASAADRERRERRGPEKAYATGAGTASAAVAANAFVAKTGHLPTVVAPKDRLFSRHKSLGALQARMQKAQ